MISDRRYDKPNLGPSSFIDSLLFCLCLDVCTLQDFDVDECCDFKYFTKCVVSFCGVCSLVVSAVLTGQSFYGREIADDVMKTVLLYVISGLISWISWKLLSLQRNGERSEEENTIELDIKRE